VHVKPTKARLTFILTTASLKITRKHAENKTDIPRVDGWEEQANGRQQQEQLPSPST